MSNIVIKPDSGLVKPDKEYRQINSSSQLTQKGYELMILSNGSKFYYLDGNLHRENAPAVIMVAYQEWYIHNKLHKLLDYVSG